MPDPDEILRHLNRVTHRGPGQWMAECPCHPDRNPSLSITQREDGDGAILLHCFGCDAGFREVCEAIGISTSQLFPDTGRRDSAGPMTREVIYEYVNAVGEPVMRSCRYRYEDGTKTFRQMRYRDGEWRWGAPPPQDRPLYRLPEVLTQVANGGTVYVVEGEKDVETLEGLHVVATTNPGGAGKWLPHHTECLAGATVVVIADRDNAGIAHALHVARELRATGSAVEILQPAIGNDVSDHVGAGLSLDELEILPGGVETEFTRFVELLGGFDPTLPEHILWEMVGVLIAERAESSRPETSAESSSDADQLFQMLRIWRSDKAREEEVPAFIVFYDRTLRELAGSRPRNHQELRRVWGIGPVKVERYGDELLQILWGESRRVEPRMG